MAKKIMDAGEMKRAFTRMTYEILERNQGTDDMAIIGIRTRGDYIGRRMAKRIMDLEGVNVPYGFLDTRTYRDDREETDRQDDISDISFSVDGLHVFLVDDVLMTGRTIRAAMDALIAFGRPSKISLVTLIDRGHRELPIRADIVGKNIPTSRKEQVQVHVREIDGVDEVLIDSQD